MSQCMSTIDGLALIPLLRRLSLAPVIVTGDGGSAAVANDSQHEEEQGIWTGHPIYGSSRTAWLTCCNRLGVEISK